MRADRFRSLQQRLRREADSFEFGALIDGVSTIEPEPETPARTPDEDVAAECASAPQAAETSPADATPPAAPPEAPAPPKRPARRAAPKAPAATTPTASAPQQVAALPASRSTEAPAPEDRVRVALEALESRLLQASGRFRAAAAAGQAEEAGLRLADMNQILELLHSMDPNGDTSRKLGTTCAPPKGRTWPRPVWTLAEFAESPLSGMLPANAAEPFVRAVFYSVWGVTFE